MKTIRLFKNIYKCYHESVTRGGILKKFILLILTMIVIASSVSATSYYLKTSEKNPFEQASLYDSLARHQFELGNVDNAIALQTKAVELSNEASYVHNLGYYYYKNGGNPEEYFLSAINNQKDEEKIQRYYFHLGLYYYENQMFEKAIDAFSNIKTEEGYFNLGVSYVELYWQTNDKSLLEKAYQSYLAAGDYPNAKNNAKIVLNNI